MRRPVPAEIERVRAISAEFYPERPEEPGVWRSVAEGERTGLVAVVDGLVAGYAAVRPEPGGFPVELGYRRLSLGVADGYRGRGIGSRLLAEILAAAGDCSLLRVRVKDANPRAVDFFARLGFVEFQRMLHLEQDLSALSLPPQAKVDVAITTLAENQHRLVEIHELENACFLHIPSGDTPTLPTLEQFCSVLQDPLMLPDCFFLAEAGGEFVGLSYAARVPGRPDTLSHRFTGVRRNYWGRGIATALKWAVTGYAVAHGYARVTTATLAVNQSMRAVNRALGFAPAYAEIRLQRRLKDRQAGE